MLTWGDKRHRIILHKDPDGKSEFLFETVNFEWADALSWGVQVDLVCCADCFPDQWHQFTPHAGLVAEMDRQLRHCNNRHVFDEIARGAVTVNRNRVLEIAKGKFGSTKLNDYINDGRFPPPTTINMKDHWLEREVHEAIARIAAEDTAERRKRTAPPNRYVAGRHAHKEVNR